MTALSPSVARALDGAALLLAIALALSLYRTLRGPSGPDRIAALDLTTSLVVGAIATYSVRTREPLLLTVAMVVALVGFLGTVAVARYLERTGRSP